MKAFISVYYEALQEQAFSEDDARIAVQIASGDEEAKQTVTDLIEEIGFDSQDLGWRGAATSAGRSALR